ncbi:dysbindin-A [Aplochiton taeniatus]
MFENFRERLQTVQQDFTSGIKTLGDKSKESKVKRRTRYEESPPQFSAGVELLSRYEDTWVLLHKRAKDSAKAAEAVDGEVVMLSAHWERRKAVQGELQDQLQQLPAFLGDLENITARIAHLEGDFEEMESRLQYLENLCGQCEQQRFKQHHVAQFENYKKKKRRELESLKGELDAEHAQKVAELEHATQQKLKERQKIYEEAFVQDMEHYLSTGYLQLREQAGAQVPVDVLEHMQVTDVSDLEALDDFLNSTGDDISTASSLTSGESSASDMSPCPSSQGPPLAPQTATQEAVRQEEEASEGSDGPLVQSDEEEVQVDTALVVLPEPLLLKNFDDSDSQNSETAGEMPPG